MRNCLKSSKGKSPTEVESEAAIRAMEKASILAKCNHCGGSGKCPKCNGTGWILHGDPAGNFHMHCRECQNSGKCPKCGGIGKKSEASEDV
jgi:primosomal protein N'